MSNVTVWNFAGPEPVWQTCPCGTQSNRVPCWTCSEASRRAADREKAKASAADLLPRRFRWASVGHADLARRVKLPDGLSVRDAAQRVLGAANVLLYGPSGSGKTSLAFACLRERLPDAMHVSALDLGVARIQHHAGDGEAKLVADCLRAPLLLIDELGGETKTANNAVKSVIMGRHDRDLPTWATTGFGRQELVAFYGDGALRRLTENGYVQRFGGEA